MTRKPCHDARPLACGNNNVSRSYLASQPQPATAPLTGIRVTLPKDRRVKADVYVSTMGTFVDRSDPSRGEPRIADVRTPRENPKTGKHEQKWEHKLDAAHRGSKLLKPYSHLTGPSGPLGPRSFMEKLPQKAQVELDGKRVIVIPKDGYWIDERGKVQKTVFHGPK